MGITAPISMLKEQSQTSFHVKKGSKLHSLDNCINNQIIISTLIKTGTQP
uniref:Uncharacterized protein n=1 Tax=Rhizophora mucronata TaxID=61149 RepID=A0A2P2N9J5_RHIMU